MEKKRSLQVWAETLSPEALCKPRTVSLLKKFCVQLNFALLPNQCNADLEQMLRHYKEKEIAVELWVLLSRKEGYWPNERNASHFLTLLEQTLQWLRQKKLSVSAVCIDLEPPIQQAEKLVQQAGIGFYKTLFQILRENRNPDRLYRGRKIFKQAVELIHNFSLKAQVAVFPYIIEDFVTGSTFFQDLTESPVRGPAWDSTTFMYYTTLIAQDTPFFSRKDARAYLYSALRDAVHCLGKKAECCVGLTGSAQILRPEPTYAHPSELAADIAAGAETGITTFGIYNLEGILAYPHPEKWLYYAQRVKPKRPHSSSKVRIWRRFLQALARKYG